MNLYLGKERESFFKKKNNDGEEREKINNDGEKHRENQTKQSKTKQKRKPFPMFGKYIQNNGKQF